MRTQSWILNLVAAVIATSTIFIVSAKERDTHITTYLVRLNVSVIGGDNRPIPGLAKEDFAIFEDNVAQEIAFWTHDDSSLGFSLAFDISDYEPLKLMARQVARSFVGQIRLADEVTIPQLKADSLAVLGFAVDERSLENALVETPSNDKLVGLVADAIESTAKTRLSLSSAVVVITDGRSLSGTASDRDVAYAILRKGTPIYFIILDDWRYMARPAAQSRGQRTKGLLTRLAAASGGLALVVKSKDEISAATEQIIHRLKYQYTIGYSPKNDKFDGSFRNVRVTVMPKEKRKVKVFAPSGYYAPDPEKIKEEKINDK
jgi:Ca-activated chloride channel homolog